jgi:hypothetical protein
VESLLRRDLECLFVFVSGSDGRNGTQKNVGIPVGPETAIVEITHQPTVETLNCPPVNIANLIDLRCGSAKAGENYS